MRRKTSEEAIDWLRRKCFHVARTPDGFVAVCKHGAMFTVNSKRSKLTYFDRTGWWTCKFENGRPGLEWFQSMTASYEKEML